MGKRFTDAGFRAVMAWYSLIGYPNADATVVRDATEAQAIVIDNGVSAVAAIEDEKQLLDDVAAEGHVPGTESANDETPVDDEIWVNDETWVEDDADVKDPDID